MTQAGLSERNRPLSVAEQSLHFLDRVHIGPPPGPVRTAAAWRRSDFDREDAWIQPLGDAEIAAFDAAIAFARLTGKPLDELGPEDFPLPSLAGRIEDWRRGLETGRGFLVLRGAPVDRWDQATASLFMRGLGLQFGRLGVQNPQGDVIGEVRDTGAASRDSAARKYATSAEFRFHCDASDLVGLLCVRQARSGGEMRARRPAWSADDADIGVRVSAGQTRGRWNRDDERQLLTQLRR